MSAFKVAEHSFAGFSRLSSVEYDSKMVMAHISEFCGEGSGWRKRGRDGGRDGGLEIRRDREKDREGWSDGGMDVRREGNGEE